MRNFPPTIIVIHPRENRKKCSLEPLRNRSDLRFIEFSGRRCEMPRNYVRLAVVGPQLGELDVDSGILLLDGTWRHAERMQVHYQSVPARSLPPIRTAYPRTSKLFQDPPAGLASVEALYAAYRILGRPCDGLLNGYRWREAFLQSNGWASPPTHDRHSLETDSSVAGIMPVPKELPIRESAAHRLPRAES